MRLHFFNQDNDASYIDYGLKNKVYYLFSIYSCYFLLLC